MQFVMEGTKGGFARGQNMVVPQKQLYYTNIPQKRPKSIAGTERAVLIPRPKRDVFPVY